MITVQETSNYPNHKYILSDDKRWMYGYIKTGDKYPQLFTKPIGFDTRGRTFKVLVHTEDVPEGQRTWRIPGSNGNVYTVIETGGEYNCTCPASMYRKTECKHIQQVKGK